MFKKPQDVQERGKTLMRKKDIQKLKSEILSQLPRVSEEMVNALFGSKATVVEQCKLMSRSILYFVDGVPCFVDENGRNKLVPTLQFLWKFPTSLRTFIIHSQVSKFLLNGADLMLPGLAVLDDVEGICLEEVVQVRIINNPLPFAVGRSECSWDGILANKRRGRAMGVISCFGDCLSQMTMNGRGPNEGFVFGGKFILPLPGYDDTQLGSLLISPHSDDDDDDDDDKDEEEEEEEEVDKVKGDDTEKEEEEAAPAAAPGGKVKRFMLKKAEGEAASSQARVEATEGERDAMDTALHYCLALLLKHFVKDRGLPALVNVTWPTLLRIGQYLKRTSNVGLLVSDRVDDGVALEPLDIDIKRSHYRNVAALFQDAARQKMLDLTEKDGVYSITSVNRTHDAFRNVRMLNIDAFKDGIAAMEEGPASAIPLTRGVQLVVKELHKVPKNLRSMFTGLSGDKEHLTLSEIKEALVTQFKQDGLEHPHDRGSVLIPENHGLHKLAMQIGGVSMGGASSGAATGTSLPRPDMDNKNVRFREEQEQEQEEGYDGEEEEYQEQFATGGKVVAGVWVPDSMSAYSAASAAPDLSIGTVWRAPSTSLGSKKASAVLVEQAREAKGREKEKEKKKKKNAGQVAAATACGPVSIRKDLLMKGLVGKLLPSHSIQVSPDVPPRYFNGSPPVVDISVVQVRGNKNMTHIVGLDSFGIDLEDLAREFRQKFAASSTVGPSASNPKLTEVCIQGHLANEAVEFLVKTYSMPRTLLSVSLKKGVKTKKT